MILSASACQPVSFLAKSSTFVPFSGLIFETLWAVDFAAGFFAAVFGAVFAEALFLDDPAFLFAALFFAVLFFAALFFFAVLFFFAALFFFVAMQTRVKGPRAGSRVRA